MLIIIPPKKSEHPILLEIWEASVRATHHFLSEEAINDLKPCLLNDYFPKVSLFCSYNEKQTITGFGGVHNNKLEMLFIDPSYRGQGIGKTLLNHAIIHFNVNTVDVNEQNTQAVEFYLHYGFKVIDRSPQDGQGQPYPLLHMVI